MFRPVAVFIGLRYLRTKYHNHFISFMSLVAMLGIALGVMVLIVVLSVMNGFDEEIKKRIFSLTAPITLTGKKGSFNHWASWQHKLKKFSPEVLASAPFVSGEALLSSGGGTYPVMIEGILPKQEKQVTQISSKMIQGKLTQLQAKQFGIVIGATLAQNLQIKLKDKIIVAILPVSLSPIGLIPQLKKFTVMGIFKAGEGFGFDTGLAFIHLRDAQALFKLGTTVTGLHAKLLVFYSAPHFASMLMTHFPELQVITWADQFGAFFHAVKLEKTMMFLILLLIIAVAAFNLVSMLVMVVFDKAADIAILRTIGATWWMIMTIFIVQGVVIGLIGTLLGIGSGILIAWNITDIVNMIQILFHVQFLSSSVYFVNYLPSKIEWMDVVWIGGISCVLSLLATFYPAWRAATLNPIRSLYYE